MRHFYLYFSTIVFSSLFSSCKKQSCALCEIKDNSGISVSVSDYCDDNDYYTLTNRGAGSTKYPAKNLKIEDWINAQEAEGFSCKILL